jgi:cyclopropane-fatty-acyl-phospholipid synthase
MKAQEQKPQNYRREQASSAGSQCVPSHPVARHGESSMADQPRVHAVDHLIAGRILSTLGNPEIRFRLWDGSELQAAGDASSPLLWFRDRRAMFGTLVNPELQFGDLYSEGRIEVEGELPELLLRVYHGIQKRGDPSPIKRWLDRITRRIKKNTLNRAAENIHHHYDIGNDFYRLWLDPPYLQYTCAYYPDPSMSLEQAQQAKLHHVCRKLQLKPGDSVVEAGCGWGGLARFMAEHYGVTVRAYNIAREQVAYARETARLQGLSGRVEYVLDDYRNISGQYDVFVSVGMLEHVGVEQYPELGRVIGKCLKTPGRGLIHSIGRNRPKPLNAWIERRIFPGAYPPTLREAADIFESNGLSVLDVENLRQHYALTLRDWLQRYEEHEAQIRKMHDERFVRAWRLYLAGSQAAFSVGELQLFQWVFSQGNNNDIPWSRSHQYPGHDPLSSAG